MIRQIAEAHKLLGAMKRLHEENTESLKAEIARLEVELLEARKANKEVANLAMDRYFEIKRLKEKLKKTKSKLKVGKWYDARKFKIEKLQELLPIGTKVAITTNMSEDEQRTREPKSGIGKTRVTRIEKVMNETAIYVERYYYIENYWFKIIEED